MVIWLPVVTDIALVGSWMRYYTYGDNNGMNISIKWFPTTGQQTLIVIIFIPCWYTTNIRSSVIFRKLT